MGRVLLPPGNLEEKEWGDIFNALETSEFVPVAKLAREKANKPQPALELFTGKLATPDLLNERGTEAINRLLGKARVPYRLTRIGHWRNETSRELRMLAFVPWPPSDDCYQ